MPFCGCCCSRCCMCCFSRSAASSCGGRGIHRTRQDVVVKHIRIGCSVGGGQLDELYTCSHAAVQRATTSVPASTGILYSQLLFWSCLSIWKCCRRPAATAVQATGLCDTTTKRGTRMRSRTPSYY
jgi:hypothetical protein